jgi:hypothetical protein
MSAGQSVLEQSTHLGLTTRSWLLSDSCGYVGLGCPLSREDGSAVCNCYWPSPAESFSGPSPVGLAAIFYCLSFQTALFVASYDSQDHGGGIRPGLHTGERTIRNTQIIYKYSVLTSEETHYISATKPNRLMLFRETVAVYCENHTEHINTLCRQNAEASMLKRMVHKDTTGLEGTEWRNNFQYTTVVIVRVY